ncbi:hypothetical protein [Sorangium sp. So ce1078]|uniref:hypothetical protein n=1 Tax=Sorangium sp. So ce1078 TaxID=3133329 RepID=UPI003F5DB36D
MLQKTMLRSMKADLLSLVAATSATAALAALLPACGAPPADDLDHAEEEYVSERADAIVGVVKGRDACAAVRCKEGFLCEEQDGSPVCVAVPPPPVCQTDDDCIIVENYCGGCNCNALPLGESLPKCLEGEVACLVSPCLGLRASCQAGACVVANEL